MTAIKDIVEFVQSKTGHRLNRDEGMQFGQENRELTGVTVAWMATASTIQAAGAVGHELLIAHESVYYPYDALNAKDAPADWREWKVNKQRLSLLGRFRTSCLRLHGSVDEICIFDTFADILELGEPVYIDGLVKVYEISPCPIGLLIQRVKDRMGMDFLRVAGVNDLDRQVSRIGLPWGGLGLFVNVSYQQRLIAQGCDAFIAGESDSYGFRFAAEAGIPMLETGHELSENPGLRKFTEMLAVVFPDVLFSFYENPSIWRIV